jgi:predicted NBD/HSP70 family sugar kinase
LVKQLKGASAAQTHSAILDLIRSSGVVSRIELAERSGLTGATISRIVRQMLDDGLIAETGFGDPTGGKRRTLLQLNARSRHAVGISLDVVSITYTIINLAGEVAARQESPGIGSQPPRLVIQRIAKDLEVLLSRVGIDRTTILGIGIAAAGRQDNRRQMLRANPQASEWELFALESTLSAATDLPIVVENDSTCAAIGEFWVGRIPSSADFATIYMATGFGLGFVTNGDVYRGSSSNVGEIGHLVLDVDGPECWCGSRGCLEMLAAPKRIVTQALARPRVVADLGLSGKPDDIRRDAAAVAAAAAQGDPDCLPLIEESACYLAKAALGITNLLDLDQIILAGPGFGVAGDIYLRIVSSELERLSFVRAIHPTKVGLSKAGPDAAALGAASLVLHNKLTPHQTSSRLAPA